LGRAKQEYGRMVNGCRMLAERHDLYFITVTCRGKEISHAYADEHYGEWTNRLLDACRIKSKREDCQWHYVQVTERQKRLHPHSHFITTFCPKDVDEEVKKKWRTSVDGQRRYYNHTSYRSNWFQKQVLASGLGEQYEISKVREAEAASRYVAKYLFKPSIFADSWPKGWKRIRYSQSFPKAAERETEAIALVTQEDWYDLAQKAVIVIVDNLDTFEEASNRLHFHDTIVRLKSQTKL
jgi:hypothetical protein